MQHLNIPADVHFSDLALEYHEDDKSFTFNFDPLSFICSASGLPISDFEDSTADSLDLIAAWYAKHRSADGVSFDSAEQLLAMRGR